MIDFIEDSNVFEMWEFADALSLESLRLSCETHVLKNFDTMWADENLKFHIFDSSPHIFKSFLRSEKLILRHPVSKLILYANDREKAIIEIIHEYCAARSDHGAEAQKLLANCVNWIFLSIKDDEVYHLLEKIEGDQSMAKEMFNTAISCKEALRTTFLSGENSC